LSYPFNLYAKDYNLRYKSEAKAATLITAAILIFISIHNA